MSRTWRGSPSGGGPVSRARRNRRHPQRRLHPALVAADRPRQALHRLSDGMAAGAAADRCPRPRRAPHPGPGRARRLLGPGPGRTRRPGRGTAPEAARRRPPVRGVQGRRRLPVRTAVSLRGPDPRRVGARPASTNAGCCSSIFGLSQAPENLRHSPAPAGAPERRRPGQWRGPGHTRAAPGPTFTTRSLPRSWRWSASWRPPGPLSAEPRRRPRLLRNRRRGGERSSPPQHAG